MNRILITGISGFVGGHLADFLRRHRPESELYGISRTAPNWDFVPAETSTSLNAIQADLFDLPKTREILDEIRPDAIVHLASSSSVAASWKSPVESFQNNTNIFLNILESVRTLDISCRILSVGSSEEYGIVNPEDLPLTEEARPRPASPYAVARVSQEQLGRIFTEGYGLDICCTRSFNHIGPGQTDRFVVSSMVRQIAEIESGHRDPVLHVGDVTIVRDFLDVRDVLRAYDALLYQGRSGTVYNICSGTGRTIEEVIQMTADLANVDVRLEQDPERLRPVDNPRIVGSNARIHKETGWAPEIPFEQSLQDMLTYWRERV
jgi:GDP-4-dehydro-6-deoxy-D-mannose reductase